jgi:hypothetical protein
MFCSVMFFALRMRRRQQPVGSLRGHQCVREQTTQNDQTRFQEEPQPEGKTLSG